MHKSKLYAPPGFWAATPEQLAEVCNGCGTGGWKGKLVPDRMWGLDITLACQIHDWMYRFGKTEEDKLEADRVFLNNLLRIINNHGGWLTWPRRYRATTYYSAVRDFGGPAYWDGKNEASMVC